MSGGTCERPSHRATSSRHQRDEDEADGDASGDGHDDEGDVRGEMPSGILHGSSFPNSCDTVILRGKCIHLIFHALEDGWKAAVVRYRVQVWAVRR